MPWTRAWLSRSSTGAARQAEFRLGRPPAWCACSDSAEGDQPLGGVRPAVEEHVFDALAQLRGDLFVDVQLPGVDDPHVQPGADRVIEERRVHRPAHRVVAAEGERDVAHAAGDLHAGEELLDLPRGLDEVHRVAVVLLDARADGEDVRIEDDVLRRHADLLGEQVIGPAGDAHLVLDA